MLTYQGAIRVYFNLTGAYPRLVAIDKPGHDWEINCKVARISGPCTTNSDVTANSHDPSFWLEGYAKLVVDADGSAIIVFSEPAGICSPD